MDIAERITAKIEAMAKLLVRWREMNPEGTRNHMTERTERIAFGRGIRVICESLTGFTPPDDFVDHLTLAMFPPKYYN